MGFVDKFIQEWHMQPPMNPVNAIVGKKKEPNQRLLYNKSKM